MLRAYSIFKDLDKKACEILTNAGHINSESGYDTFEDIISYI